ncbi:unnamed protein product [Musa acuminata subsp. malaccensis]|uniref:(wild Malaysian banana) hypothetical protein n=1 Tax=Musa acuminata subsp. malaccensis TaxID=214687 RepID=A0A8D7B6P7_MUSAM|nr:unnamed protein product [Musa acuminata subsp. malaccensis]
MIALRRSLLLASLLCFASHGSCMHSSSWDPRSRRGSIIPPLFFSRSAIRQPTSGPDDEAPPHWPNFSAVSYPEHLNYALLFRHFTPHPNLYIYNIIISALSFSPGQSFDLYKCMLCAS